MRYPKYVVVESSYRNGWPKPCDLIGFFDSRKKVKKYLSRLEAEDDSEFLVFKMTELMILE